MADGITYSPLSVIATYTADLCYNGLSILTDGLSMFKRALCVFKGDNIHVY